MDGKYYSHHLFHKSLMLNFYFTFRDNPRFGINDWHNEWEGSPQAYTFGQNLNKAQSKKLVKNQNKN